MPIDKAEQVKIDTLKTIYGILLVCAIGVLFYFLSMPMVMILNEKFKLALAFFDVEIVFVIVVVLSVKALFSIIDRIHRSNRIE